MRENADVIIIGAGAGGPVVAKELGEKGLKVLLLEAGPWYGNSRWAEPNQEKGAVGSSDPADLSSQLLHNCFNRLEEDMNDTLTGKLRWGPADRRRSAWFRHIPQGGFAWQNSGVGGTTLHYFANSPRAFPAAVDGVWPIAYGELIPYYEQVEATLPVRPAPMTAKEELFFVGAKKAGWSLLKTLNVQKPGYRPQPNAILPPHPDINQEKIATDDCTKGCSLCGHCINGCSIGPSVPETAKRSTLVSYVPLALKTGWVEIRPNTAAVQILTENNQASLRAVGVRCRNTWTGETEELRAKVIVLAAGTIETPRLWLNSGLPENPWVGRGLTTHWFDCVAGIFDERVLRNILGTPAIQPFVGPNSAARLDYPGVGAIQNMGLSPGLFASLIYSLGQHFYCIEQPQREQPWDIRGRVTGSQLQELMLDYTRTMAFLILTDDSVNQQNGITLDPLLKDEHGPVPQIKYQPSVRDRPKRDKLAQIAAEILKAAGAKTVIRTESSPCLLAHMHGTMRMGYVTDSNGEALQVERLYVADNSVHYNSLGGPNPTLTTQALAVRTAEKLADKYFS